MTRVVHGLPRPIGEDLTPCCRRAVEDIPEGDRFTPLRYKETCEGVVDRG